jgi:cation-transporting P-type ATPase E
MAEIRIGNGGDALQGLTDAEAAARRARGQGNLLYAGPSRSYRRIFAQNTFTPINVTLFVICLALAALRLFGDAAMTASLVLANVVVAVFQEARAKQKLDQIAVLTRPTATVVRGGRAKRVNQEKVVLGDILLVKPGDQFVVDGEVVSEKGLAVDESPLTGESDLITKKAGDPVHSGTYCMAGRGAYVAQKVGTESLAQQLTIQAREFRTVNTPLQREVGIVLRVMGVLVVALSIQVVRSYQGSAPELPVSDAFRAAAVLVSLVPQGLSLMVTVTYAMAVVRMAGSGALIQRINAVESTSYVDTLCFDKTGTLTTNKLKLADIRPLTGNADEVRARLGDFATSTPVGNQTIAAITAACPGETRSVRDEVQFSSDRKWSALALGDAKETGSVYVLGAPEVLQPALRDGSDIQQQVEEWAARGLRVVLFASAVDGASLHDTSGEPSLPLNLEPLALVSLRDELRPEAKETIAEFAKADIALKIISGDNPDTVVALAKQAGLASDLQAVSGLDLDKLNEAEFGALAERTTVFGRITPQQKERLINALREQKHYVAMIGDGVNDVLALKQADLAVAMRSGSQVTRSVADVVLLNNSFGAMPKAFLEGQRIRRGMMDIVRLFLARTLSVALIIFGSTLIGAAFPITPRQNGLLAFLTVGIPTFALAAWARPGRTPRHLVTSGGYFVVPAAVSIAFVGVIIYDFYLSNSGAVISGQSALTTITILCGLLLIPFAQPPTETFVGGSPLNGDWRPTVLAGALFVLFGVILGVPALRNIFELELLSVSEYAIIAYVVLGWAVTLRFLWRLDAPAQVGKLWRRLIAWRP